ncbi:MULTISPECIES: ATP-dependent 6-phosphofructokinase [Bacillaceae]|uniref:ATP-dependent 6-phosphofructokinase n=1 Tax=Bacillaceae TaxID=186817 RepID=UPI001E65A330|nr:MULTISPECIES: ATP-dependent 6-phosphofructokinase [Bacillaceae]MCE4049626.1 ATP-dependent 6-phosphofructokinase [Bacillus sp. Au-Bac7]MCM3031797.1 ATP-dependent 6-phosphofructokinase [Niallia sp. MER 6]MDL0437002.1 ATP-dependent 6-phosphofructokinase [Niallia sp. SS-2023]
MKKLAVITSGGDSPGMNAALFGVVKEAARHEIQVFGCVNGYIGIIKEEFMLLTESELFKVIDIGGTILGTQRFPEFADKDIQTKAVDILRKHEIDGLVVIGGDGSYQGAKALSQLGFPVAAIPGTIDNDIALTDITLGFHTAVENAVDAIDKIKTSAASHKHIFGIEVMGREASDIAIWAGLATAADGIIGTSEDWNLEKVLEGMRSSAGKSQIYILAEGAISAEKFKAEIESHSEFKIHPLVLGHIQRGGKPSVTDRIMGIKFGEKSVETLLAGKSGICLAVHANAIVELELGKVLSSTNKEPFLPY